MMPRDPRRKCLVYVVGGVIVMVLLVVLFMVLVMRVRRPTLVMSSVSLLTSNNNSMDLDATLSLKNTNFGHFSFNATFSLRGSPVATATAPVPAATAFARSTKILHVPAHLSLSAPFNLHRRLKLTASARVDGEVHLLKAFKRRRSAEMDCTFEVHLPKTKVENLKCM